MTVLLLLAAFICFALATLEVQSKVSLVPLGLLFWVLASLLPMLLAIL